MVVVQEDQQAVLGWQARARTAVAGLYLADVPVVAARCCLVKLELRLRGVMVEKVSRMTLPACPWFMGLAAVVVATEIVLPEGRVAPMLVTGVVTTTDLSEPMV